MRIFTKAKIFPGDVLLMGIISGKYMFLLLNGRTANVLYVYYVGTSMRIPESPLWLNTFVQCKTTKCFTSGRADEENDDPFPMLL